MLCGEPCHHGQGARAVITGCMRVDGGGVEQLPGRINDGNLAPCADAWVDAHDGLLPGGRRQEQILQIAGKDLDGLGLGAGLQPCQGVRRAGFGEPGRPGFFRRFLHPAIPRTAGRIKAEFLTDAGDGLTRRIRLARLDPDAHFQYALLFPAQHGERAVGGHFLEGFGKLGIVPEFLSLLALDEARAQFACGPDCLAGMARQARRLGHPFYEDVACAFQRRCHGCDPCRGVHEGSREGFRIACAGQQLVRQGLKPLFAGDHRPGPAPRLVGAIQIFQLDLGLGRPQSAFQGRRQLSLFGNRRQNGLAPRLQLG